MAPRLRLLPGILAVCLACLAASASESAGWTTEYRWGGCGGLHLLAEPGVLWVEIEKRDLSAASPRHVRVVFFGPDRRAIEDLYLDAGGGKGDGVLVSRARFETAVPRKGLYGVSITCARDRYGKGFSWGFRTNCARYLVETSRGHKDARHEEPLVLRNPEVAGDVCFRPRAGAVAVEATGLPAGTPPLTLLDGTGAALAELPVSEAGAASCTIRADAPRGAGPWRLHLPRFAGTIQIDGVTRWENGAPFEHFSLWTPEASSWFALHEHRWLLTPYARTVYVEPGAEGGVTFEVHNNDLIEKTVALEVDAAGADVVELGIDSVTLDPGETQAVDVHYRAPEGDAAWRGRIVAVPRDGSGVTTWSTLELRPGPAPAAKPLPLPVKLEPYAHENAQFGYLPRYPLTNQAYFDLENRPVIASDKSVWTWRDGAWRETAVSTRPDGAEAEFTLCSSKAAFDADNDLYLLGEQGGAQMLLHSHDGGKSFASTPIPGRGRLDIEQPSGHNAPDGPPPIVRYTLTARDPKVFWRRVNDLDLFLPKKTGDGAIVLGEPVRLSGQAIGISMHSGIPSTIVSRGGKVHVAWGEATDPEDTTIVGVPAYVATCDRATGVVSAPVCVGYGPPPNDVHNTPCITMDSKGYLHVLTGTHGQAFRYARSLEPNTASAGWTPAEEIGEGLRQTYIGMVCDRNDVLHVAFRLWRDDAKYFPAGVYANLAVMSKKPGAPWQAPRVLVVAAFADYSIFYHRLTIDRGGRLFLSYDYWSTYWFYRMDHRGGRRALMMSPDGGATWALAGLDDLR